MAYFKRIIKEFMKFIILALSLIHMLVKHFIMIKLIRNELLEVKTFKIDDGATIIDLGDDIPPALIKHGMVQLYT